MATASITTTAGLQSGAEEAYKAWLTLNAVNDAMINAIPSQTDRDDVCRAWLLLRLNRIL